MRLVVVRQSLVMTRHALVVARQPLVSVRQPLALARQRGSLVASMPVAAQAMSALFEVLERRGVTRSRLGISRVTSDEALAGLWERAIALVGRPTLPLEVGLETPLGAMGVVDYLAASAEPVSAATSNPSASSAGPRHREHPPAFRVDRAPRRVCGPSVARVASNSPRYRPRGLRPTLGPEDLGERSAHRKR